MQYYKSNLMKPDKRAQITDFYIGRLNSESQKEQILEDFCSGAGENKRECMATMKQIYNKAVQMRDNHGFLHIDTRKQFGEGRLTVFGHEGSLDTGGPMKEKHYTINSLPEKVPNTAKKYPAPIARVRYR